MSAEIESSEPTSLPGWLGNAGIGAIAAGVAVLVQDNRFLALWFVVVGLGLLWSRWKYDWLVNWRSRRRWLFVVSIVFAALVVAATGVSAFLFGVDNGASAIDENARAQGTAAQQQASAAQQQIAALRTEVAQLRGEVKAATDFQQTEKEAREARDRANAAEMQRQEQLAAQQAQKIQDGIRTTEAMRVEWEAYQRKASNVCSKDQIGTMSQELSILSRKTSAALSDAGFSEYVPDFEDNSRCSSSEIPTQCFTRGFNPEAVQYFRIARCRVSNLRAIVDRLRAR